MKFLDFSLNNAYLLYKNDEDEVIVTDIISKKKVSYFHAQSEIEWMSDGIQISNKTKVVLYSLFAYLLVQRVCKVTMVRIIRS